MITFYLIDFIKKHNNWYLNFLNIINEKEIKIKEKIKIEYLKIK